jgi:hypothetical protein
VDLKKYRAILSLEAPDFVYLQIFNEFVSQLTDDELTTGYYQKDAATCHTPKRELSQKTFGHPDLSI